MSADKDLGSSRGGAAVATRALCDLWRPNTTHRTWRQLAQRAERASVGPGVNFCLLRHGETVTNALGLITGSLDVPLTDVGRAEAVESGVLLRRQAVDVAFASTLQRCVETRDIALEAAGLSHAVKIVDARLNERGLGVLEGRKRRFIPELAAGDMLYAPPGGESYNDVSRRCLSFLLDVADLAVRAGHRLDVLLVTHMGPMRILVGILGGMSDPVAVLAQEFDNSAPICLRMDKPAWPLFGNGHP